MQFFPSVSRFLKSSNVYGFAVKHKEKVYENDSLKLKLDQAMEFKIKIMESQAALKKELEQIKKEKEEVVQAHEDLSDIADALEMATLDKEMAEEKVFTVTMSCLGVLNF